MKKLLFLQAVLIAVIFIIPSCQEDFIKEIEDRPTDMIEFRGISASKDSACMFDTILLTADAKGDNLRYTWQHAKGSLVAVEGEPSKVYFWGCQTCLADLTISCTVENEYGAYTKEISVFIYPWYTWQEPWTKEKLEKWLEHFKNKK